MNSLQIVMNEIKPASQSDAIPVKEFIIKLPKQQANRRQVNKILEYAKELECLSKMICLTMKSLHILKDLIRFY